MNSNAIKLGALVAMATIAGAAMAVPTGSFCRKPVRTVSALVAHMNSDPVFADRMMRHFRKPKGELVAYLGSLHLAKLTRSGAYTVFNVHDGIIRSRVLKMSKGALVFADSNGRPILVQACCNPMVWEVPGVGSSVDVSASAMEREFVGEAVPTDMVALSEPGVLPVPDDIPPSGPIVQAPATGVVSGGRSNFLPILGLLGAGAAFIRTGGGGDDTPPVPEPASIAVMAAGAGSLIARRRRNKR